MKSLLKEVARGGMQADLKTSDGSSAGAQDVASKPVDIGFSLMRNAINTDKDVTGSDVNNYLERAQDMNDEIETAGFAIETDNGDIIKVYVNATEADAFEEELSKLLGLEGDSEEAINQLAQKYDIVDVVWPNDPEGSHEDPDKDLTIDDAAGSVLDVDEPPEPPTDDEGAVLGHGAEGLPPEGTGDDEIDAAAAGDESEKPKKHKPKKAKIDDEGFEDIPAAEESEEGEEGEAPAKKAKPESTEDNLEPEGGEEVTGAENAEEEEEEPVLNDDGTQKLDKDGNPVMKKKKAPKKPKAEPEEGEPGEEIKTEEGLVSLHKFAMLEDTRGEIDDHVAKVQAKGDKGKYLIQATVSGGITGRRAAPVKKDGEIRYFDTKQEADTVAAQLTKQKNRAGATASYKYASKLVEDNTMTIGSTFLSRLAEATKNIKKVTEAADEPEDASEQDSVPDDKSIPLDTVQKGFVSQLHRPLEKRLIAFYALAGVTGRLLKREEDVIGRVRGAAEMLRKNSSTKNAFIKFYNALATAKGYTAAVPEIKNDTTEVPEEPKKVAEAKDDHHGESKRGSAIQKKLEAILVALGLPEGLVTISGPSQIGSFVARTAQLIVGDGELQSLMNMLAVRLNVHGSEAPEDREAKKADKITPVEPEEAEEESTTEPEIKESSLGRSFLRRLDELVPLVKSADPFVENVISLLRGLGVTEDHLGYKKDALIKSIAAVRNGIKNRTMVNQRMLALMPLLKPSVTAATESLTEAFDELKALSHSDLEHFNMQEPSYGPAMLAKYEGGGAHAETVLAMGIDPNAEGQETLRVGIDGPWDGSLHSKYFPDDKDGYKEALQYANILRTWDARSGGRPKGWK